MEFCKVVIDQSIYQLISQVQKIFGMIRQKRQGGGRFPAVSHVDMIDKILEVVPEDQVVIFTTLIFGCWGSLTLL